MERDLGVISLPPNPLREQWNEISLRTVWLHPGDWYHPAVDALVEAIDEGRDPLPAAERLGHARGEHGAGIGETLDDLACLYAAIGVEPPLPVLRAVCTGWSEGQESVPHAMTCIDPVSGLGSLEYFTVRLRETYARARRAGRPAGSTHCLIVVDVAVEGLSLVQRFSRSATIGQALMDAFGEGYPMASLGAAMFAVLAERDAGLVQAMTTVRECIDDLAEEMRVASILRQPPRIWVESLPDSIEAATDLVSHLRR